MHQLVLRKRPHLIPCIIAAVLLLGALGERPYGYYQLLRFAVCSVSVYVAYIVYGGKKLWATWLFGIVGVLFNPLVPIHLSRELWQPIDLMTGVLFAVTGFTLKRPEQALPEDTETSNQE